MPNYTYTAINKKGKKQKGLQQASSISDLKSTLQYNGLHLLSHKEQKATKKTFKYNKPLSSAELSPFCRQLSIILSSGVSMLNSLSLMAKQSKKKHMREELQRLHDGMLMGNTMYEIMSAPESRFPSLLSGMVNAGEASGTLDKVFKSMAEYYDRDSTIRKKVKSASTYPTILIVLATAMTFGFLKFILPSMLDIITSTGSELPAMTKFVVNLANFVGTQYIWIFLALAGIVTGYKLGVKTDTGRRIRDTLIMKTPILNTTIQNIATSRFAQGIHLFSSSGYSLIKGLELLSSTTGNYLAEQSIKRAIRGVNQGQELVANLQQDAFFDPIFLQMLSVGEATGSMSTVSKEMADHYDKEVEISIAKTVAMVEPIMTIIIGGIIGFLLISMAGPMMTMYNNIGD